MSKPFNAAEFVGRMGERLVSEFADAAYAGTPGLIGSAREHPARRQVERLLPASAAIGSGIVIDSFGNQSKQQDIVIFDRHQCPVFSINDTAEATFFPCEGVIAVGEVKSTLADAELHDSFEKIASVKRLRRFAAPKSGLTGELSTPFRSYGASNSIQGVASESFDAAKPEDQIFGFVLCARFGLVDQTMHKRARDMWSAAPSNESPNVVASLASGFLAPVARGSLLLSCTGADTIVHVSDEGSAFAFLIDRLNWVVRHGRTVPVEAFMRYFKPDPEAPQTFTKTASLSLS